MSPFRHKAAHVFRALTCIRLRLLYPMIDHQRGRGRELGP